MPRLTVHWNTEDASDLVLIASAVRHLVDRPEKPRAWLQYGEPAKVEIFVRRTPAGFSLDIDSLERP